MRRIAGVLALAVVVGCAPRAPLAPTAPPLPVFAAAPELQRLIDPRPAPAGRLAWLGGDVASSIQSGRERWIWIFGDTLLGTVEDDCPDGSAYCDRDVDDRPTHGMIPNSVGVMSRHADGSLAPLETYWRESAGAPAPIFAAEDPEEFLWPLALTSVDDVLLVAASRHTRTAGLASLGDVLLRVRNPEARPDQWVYDRLPIPNARPDLDGEPVPLTWATELTAVDDVVYLFGRLGVAADVATVVARFSVRDVAAQGWTVVPEYLQRRASDSDDLVWTTDFDHALLHELAGLPGTSEATIAYDDRLGWYTFRVEWLSNGLELYTAPELLGPWKSRGVVYEIPPPDGCVGRIGEEGAGCAGVPYFAYAAKTHASLAPPGTIVVSYNVNVLSADLDEALQAAEGAPAFYIPRIIAAPPGGG